MPTPIRLLALLVLALAVAACGLLPGALLATPTPMPPAVATAATVTVPTEVPVPDDAVLVAYEARGGDCPSGMCSWRAVIHRNGRVERSDGQAQTVDSNTLARLVRSVESADWDAIMSRPNSSQCPTAYDGQEIVYTFFPTAQAVAVSSCTTVIDTQAEPFVTIGGILFGTGG